MNRICRAAPPFPCNVSNHTKKLRVPHPCRALCDRVGILADTVASCPLSARVRGTHPPKTAEGEPAQKQAQRAEGDLTPSPTTTAANKDAQAASTKNTPAITPAGRAIIPNRTTHAQASPRPCHNQRSQPDRSPKTSPRANPKALPAIARSSAKTMSGAADEANN